MSLMMLAESVGLRIFLSVFTKAILMNESPLRIGHKVRGGPAGNISLRKYCEEFVLHSDIKERPLLL